MFYCTYLYGIRFSGDTILYYLCGFRRGPLATKTGLFAKKKVMKLLDIYTALCTANMYSISFTLKDNFVSSFLSQDISAMFCFIFSQDVYQEKKLDTKPLLKQCRLDSQPGGSHLSAALGKVEKCLKGREIITP